MKIRFMGLMCHIAAEHTGNGESIVVLIREPQHHARLRIRSKYVFGKPDDDTGTEPCQDVDQCRLSFDVPAGNVNRSGLATVPKLTNHGGNGGAVLHPDIAARGVNGNLRSFISLPAGSYGVEDRFALLGQFPDGSTRCVPRTVTFDVTVPAGTSKITLSGLQGGATIELKPTATITITNLELKQNKTSHFPEYRHLFQTPVTIQQIQPTTLACPTGRFDYVFPRCSDELFQNVGVECTNTQYP